MRRLGNTFNEEEVLAGLLLFRTLQRDPRLAHHLRSKQLRNVYAKFVNMNQRLEAGEGVRPCAE